MKKRLATLLRCLADKLDRPGLVRKPNAAPYSEDSVVEVVGDNPQWHPEQTGNVIIAEPLLVSQDRMAHEVPKVQPPY